MDAFELISTVWWLGIPTGLLLGALLGMNPLALPMLGTAVALGSTGELGSKGAGVRVTAAFGAGMALVYTAVGVVASRVDQVTETILRPYAGIGYVVMAIVLIAFAVFLLARPSWFCAACARPATRNPTVAGAFLAGIPGGFVNCPACAGIVLGIAGAAASVGNPFYSGSVMMAVGIGHASVLTLLTWLLTRNRAVPPGMLGVLQKAAAVLLGALGLYFLRLALIQGVQPGPRLP